jgi:uracil-DNA glycosylase
MLENLYARVDQCTFCKEMRNTLQHIHGYGLKNPRYMLVLINPTHRNLSSQPGYIGPRFPFIGVRQFWNVLGGGGLIGKAITQDLPLRNKWTADHTSLLQKELEKNKLFLTNIVKCCYPHGDYPSQEVIDAQKSILQEEIRFIKPKQIIAFGGLTFKTLTGENIKLSEYWLKKDRTFNESLSGLNIPITPCYFPIGRGSPKKAAQALRNML